MAVVSAVEERKKYRSARYGHKTVALFGQPLLSGESASKMITPTTVHLIQNHNLGANRYL
jgi:hypothetical protein